MMKADGKSGLRWPKGSVQDAYSPRCCSTFAAVLLVTLGRFSEDADIVADLVHLQKQSSKVGSKTALECVQRAIWGMLLADDAYIVSRSPRGLGRVMAVFV